MSGIQRFYSLFIADFRCAGWHGNEGSSPQLLMTCIAVDLEKGYE